LSTEGVRRRGNSRTRIGGVIPTAALFRRREGSCVE
jgi:hypothetical protein